MDPRDGSGAGEDLLEQDTRSTNNKIKAHTLDIIKSNNFHSAKDTLKSVQRQSPELGIDLDKDLIIQLYF